MLFKKLLPNNGNFSILSDVRVDLDRVVYTPINIYGRGYRALSHECVYNFV
jgi:hypothetical protein